MEGDYLLKVKQPDGKWKTYGSLKKNKFGNYTIGFKNTPEFKALINGGGDWVNMSVFEDKPKETPQAEPEYDQTIPF